jgi:hypothetical protein
LLDTSDGCILDTLVGAMLVEGGINLSSAENYTLNFIWLADGFAMLRVWDYPLELRVASELRNIRSSKRVTEKRLGEEDNESYIYVNN